MPLTTARARSVIVRMRALSCLAPVWLAFGCAEPLVATDERSPDAGTLPVDGDDDTRDAGVADAGTDERDDEHDDDEPDGGTTSDAGTQSCSAGVVDYTCVVGEPDTCAGGQCWFGSCVGPTVDNGRFAACGDGVCSGCDDESALDTWCPADCAAEPPAPARAWNDPATLTVFVHGIDINATPLLMAREYGAPTTSREIGARLLALDPALADGIDDAHDDEPHQLVGVEYYGRDPHPAVSASDAAWIEEIPADTPDAIFRYARVVAAFTRARMASTGALHVNLLCHSMGCLVTRALIELDLLALSSSGALARVVTVSGAVQGARMANMIDNPVVQEYAGQGAFNIWDIAALDPDNVLANVAVWNHDLAAADNPAWRGVRVHSLGGSDPTLDEALDLFSLGAIHNPDELPQDGVVFSLESFFATQRDVNRVVATSGARLAPTHVLLDFSHNEILDQDGTALVVHAALFARRVAFVTLEELTVLDDHESGFEPGDGDAELALEQRVTIAGALVDERKLADRTPALVVLAQGETASAPIEVFASPVPDGVEGVHVAFDVIEVDKYRRYGLAESTFIDASEPLATFDADVPFVDGTYALAGAGATGAVRVRVETLD